MTIEIAQIQIRRGTAAAWTSANPVLAAGELGLETNTGLLKIGNGTSAWNALSYYNVAPVVSSIAYAASITPAVSVGSMIYAIGTLTGPITINNPTGTPFDGQNVQFIFAQDATGGRAITWGSAFQFGTDVTAALIPTQGSAKWRMAFIYNAAVSKWQAVAIARGF